MLQAIASGGSGAGAPCSREKRRAFESFVAEALSQMNGYEDDVAGLLQDWMGPRTK